MDEVKGIIARLAGGELGGEEAATLLVAASATVEGAGDKALAPILQAAKEVVHYHAMALEAPTPQWQSSFLFEKQQSQKALVKAAKAYQKKAG